jgi:hypothetical protein
VEEKICVNTAVINLGLSSNRESKKKQRYVAKSGPDWSRKLHQLYMPVL